MNKQKQIQINNSLREVEFSNVRGSHINTIRISTSNSLEHEMKKLEICYELREQEIDFMTEVKFVNGGRADVLDLVNGEIIEIVKTESNDSLAKKSGVYPSGFSLRIVRV